MQIHLAIDRPRPGVPVRSYSGWLEVTGWAAAAQPISAIEVRVPDGAWQRAIYGQPRPDVAKAHPRLAHSGRSGFRAFVPLGGQADVRRLEVRAVAGTSSKEVDVAVTSEVRRIDLAGYRGKPLLEEPCPWCNNAGALRRTDQGHGPFLVVGCETCDFSFAGPWPAAADLVQVYEIEYWANAPSGPDVLCASADTEFIAAWFTKFGNGGKRVLEVGCGQGTLLYGLRQGGFEVTGQDLAQNAARTLERVHGVPIWRQPLSLLPDHRWDCIVTRHVIEHSVTPRADLRWMRDHLNPGGVLALLTPNWRSLAAELLGTSWEWFVPPVHVGYFSARSLAFLQEAAGLEICALTTREGDGAPFIESVQTHLDYEGPRLTESVRRRCEALIAGATNAATPGPWLRAAAAPDYLGQEIVAVFKA